MSNANIYPSTEQANLDPLCAVMSKADEIYRTAVIAQQSFDGYVVAIDGTTVSITRPDAAAQGRREQHFDTVTFVGNPESGRVSSVTTLQSRAHGGTGQVMHTTTVYPFSPAGQVRQSVDTGNVGIDRTIHVSKPKSDEQRTLTEDDCEVLLGHFRGLQGERAEGGQHRFWQRARRVGSLLLNGW